MATATRSAEVRATAKSPRATAANRHALEPAFRIVGYLPNTSSTRGRAARKTVGVQTERIHPKTRVGHIHLRVADLDRAIGFYRDLLGFNLTADGLEVGIDAAFLAAGDYTTTSG